MYISIFFLILLLLLVIVSFELFILLKFPSGRVEYQSKPSFSGVPSFKHLLARLPPRVHSVYYRDEIGNISSSHLRTDPWKVICDLLTYSSILEDYLYYLSKECVQQKNYYLYWLNVRIKCTYILCDLIQFYECSLGFQSSNHIPWSIQLVKPTSLHFLLESLTKINHMRYLWPHTLPTITLFL